MTRAVAAAIICVCSTAVAYGQITLTNVSVNTCGNAGVRVLEGTVVLDLSKIQGNQGDGVVLGDLSTQTGPVVGTIQSSLIFQNTTGVRAQQKDATTASTKTTLYGNHIHDNRASGIYIRSSFLQRPSFPGAVSGIVSNEVYHNAMSGVGCTASQSAPQILFEGPVPVSPDQVQCAAATMATCDTLRASGTSCVWTGTSCAASYDMRGDLSTFCSSGQLNAILDYNTSDTGSFLSVGLRAIGSAVVDADNNVWRSADTTQNYSTEPGSFIKGNLICSTRATCLSSVTEPRQDQ